jgi:hypothetical protein
LLSYIVHIIYTIYSHSVDPYTITKSILNCYITYCVILSEVIKTAKKYIIINSSVIPIRKLRLYGTLLKRKPKNDVVPPLNIDGKAYKDYQNIANIFSTYFTNVTDKISANDSVTINVASNTAHPQNYLYQVFGRPLPNIKLTPLSTKRS